MISSVKALGKRILYRPRLGALGADTLVLTPRRIKNPDRIFIGRNVIIYPGVNLFPILAYEAQRFSPKISIGDDVYVGHHVQLHCIAGISIAQGCVLSDYVYLNDAAHGVDPNAGPIMKQSLQTKGPISLAENCFLGHSVRVLSGVNLGPWCVVGTGAVVTRSFPAYSMIGGAPARLLKSYSFEKAAWVAPDGTAG